MFLSDRGLIRTCSSYAVTKESSIIKPFNNVISFSAIILTIPKV